MADVMAIAPYILFVAAVVAVSLYILQKTARQTRGTFGRPYPNVVTDMMRENARRSQLLLRFIELRDGRLARLEGRAEGRR
jgi:hypothetical protein